MPLATREKIWEELPPLDGTPEVKVEKKEVKEVVDGNEITKVVEVRTSVVRKLKCVEERKGWELFGLSEEDIKANDGMSECEETGWERPVTDKRAERKQTDKIEFEEVKCRFCGGSHFSHACPHKVVESDNAEDAKPSAGESTSSSEPSTGKYSLKHLGLATSGSRGGDRDRDREEFKVRVSNLDEDASEDDFRLLLDSSRLRYTRFFLKRKYGGGNYGYAFISFETEKDAQQACQKLNGHPYGHLILSVEMQTQKKK